MLRVIRNHRRAAHGESRGYEALAGQSRTARSRLLPAGGHHHHAKAAWDKALELGSSMATATRRPPWWRRPAPSASCGCDTTGIEPDFAW